MFQGGLGKKGLPVLVPFRGLDTEQHPFAVHIA